jgi:hypothetical protein
MSGGAFEYKEREIKELLDLLHTNMDVFVNECKKAEEKLDLNVLDAYTEAAIILQKAYIYLNRLDYLFSGDDDQESFLRRLKNDLEWRDSDV